MADLINFDAFRKQIDSINLDDHAQILQDVINKQVQAARGVIDDLHQKNLDVKNEIVKMNQFLIDHYAGTSVVHSFTDEGGRVVDCMPFDQQPSVLAARKLGIDVKSTPPASERSSAKSVEDQAQALPIAKLKPPLARGLKDSSGNAISVPPGTVPVRRITLDHLMLRGRLENFFKKGLPCDRQSPLNALLGNDEAPLPLGVQAGPDGNIHLHAGVQAAGQFSGASSFLSVWKPDISPGNMSLSQQWIFAPNPAPSGYPITVEGGWQVLDTDPVLFVFFNPDGYGNQSGYTTNRSGQGFITYKEAQWTPGGSIGAVSSIGGPQVGFVMEWTLDSTGWVLSIGNDAGSMAGVGYFPIEYYNGNFATGAAYAQFGGEVAGTFSGTGQMGSGSVPLNPLNSGYQKVAFQYDVSVRNVGSTTFSPATGLTLIGEAPGSYVAAQSSSNTWGTHFWFGGANYP